MHNFPAGWRFAAPGSVTAFQNEHLTKARRLVTRSGRRSRGRFPTAKAAGPQPYESQLELQGMRLLELATSVKSFTSQPARTRLADAPALKYTPDLAAVLQDDQQCLLEVKPARMFLDTRILARMTEVARLYQQLGQELHFLLDSDLHPTSTHGALLRDALHWAGRARPFPGVAISEGEAPTEDADAAPTEAVCPPAGFAPMDLAAIKADCDRILHRALNRSFEDTVAAAREALWQEVLA